MPDSEHLTAGARFAPSVPARQEAFALKGCGRSTGACRAGWPASSARTPGGPSCSPSTTAISRALEIAAEFFDATVLEVADEIEVADGRFSIAIVTAGDGWAEGDFGQAAGTQGPDVRLAGQPVPRLCAGRAPVRVVRCLGPADEVTR